MTASLTRPFRPRSPGLPPSAPACPAPACPVPVPPPARRPPPPLPVPAAATPHCAAPPRRAALSALLALLLALPLSAAPLRADGPGLPAAPRGGWAVLSGGDLRGTLEAWALGAGWTLVWDSPLNYRLRASARYDGDFETAVAGLIDAIHLSNPELRVTLYRGNRVLHVETALVETR